MKKYIPFILSSFLVIGFCFLVTEKAFSQSFQDGYNSDTTQSVTTASDGDSSYTYEKSITPERARSLIGVAMGLISLVIGWRVRFRSATGTVNKRRNGAVIALLLGAIAIVLSIIHLSASAGAVFGSGSGKAGAIVGLVLGLLGTTFSSFALRHMKDVVDRVDINNQI